MRPPGALARGLTRVLAMVATTAALSAQISPGPLSAPHAALEGGRHCFSCHRAGEGVEPALCLDCHRALAARVESGLGLHARPDHRTCERCHSEHNGREFELVHFPGGRESFEHADTGWALEGRHARLECAACHRADRVDPALATLESELDLTRTHLGLASVCASCHDDPHRSARTVGCADCHGQESFRPASGFDHARTRYPLDGAHARVACGECHRDPGAEPAPAGERSLLFGQFAGGQLPGCGDCHADPHRGRLGADCADCHATASFRGARATDGGRGFDHSRTAYPLAGRHGPVACADCHTAGRALRIPGFARCETCHRDPHAGQLARAATGGACADCHGVEGFVPARFGIGEHARSAFPLTGAHGAVPCFACHQEVALAELPAPFARRGAGRTRRFRYAAAACIDCHRDPHEGRLDRYAGSEGCASCHDVSNWRTVRFDHDRTRLPLTGRHAALACAGCHADQSAAAPARLSGLPRDCAGCHRDVHAGQLARGGVTACERCHSVDGFRPTVGFDHGRDARWALDGAHARVACAGCHRAESVAGESIVRYRPLPFDCAGCHSPAEQGAAVPVAAAHAPSGGPA